MPSAGEYRTRLEWLRRTPGTPDGFGQRQDTFDPQGWLWCAIEDLAANRVTEQESERHQVTASVRIRNYPAVAPGDRLRGTDGREWEVRTAVEGDNEVLCEVRR
jgi:head-tail adaptor